MATNFNAIIIVIALLIVLALIVLAIIVISKRKKTVKNKSLTKITKEKTLDDSIESLDSINAAVECTESIFLNRVLPKGTAIWSFNDNDPEPKNVLFNGKLYDGLKLAEIGAERKRNGNYKEALDIYNTIINAGLDQYGKVNIWAVRSLIKVLASTNNYVLFYRIVATVVADIQTSSKASGDEVTLFCNYFKQIYDLVMTNSGSMDSGAVLAFSANYSGNSAYKLLRKSTEIQKEIDEVREILKQTYGK